MKRMTLKLKNQSIDNTGIKQDYQDALCEYIWNGFEANATTVSLSYTLNKIDGIEKIIIEDDGDGIIFELLDDTFGAFMASQKNTIISRIKSQNNKGKGRFAFTNFATDALWETTYKIDDLLYSYEIALSSSQKEAVDHSEEPIKSSKNKLVPRLHLRASMESLPKICFMLRW